MPRSSTNSYNDLFPAVKTVKTLHRKFTPTIYTTINYLHLMETVQVHFGSQMPGAGGSVTTKNVLAQNVLTLVHNCSILYPTTGFLVGISLFYLMMQVAGGVMQGRQFSF